MIQKLKMRLLAVGVLILSAAPLAVPVVATAQTDPIQAGVCSGAQDLKFGGTTGCNSNTDERDLNDLIATVINIISVIVGVIAVIMIIIGGFRYITSGGDSTKVGAAKNTILYALIGLIIVAIAQVIVKFVLTKSTGTITGGTS